MGGDVLYDVNPELPSEDCGITGCGEIHNGDLDSQSDYGNGDLDKSDYGNTYGDSDSNSGDQGCGAGDEGCGVPEDVTFQGTNLNFSKI